MGSKIVVKKKINKFNKVITVDGDKSLSIRWALLGSIAKGKSKAYNLLNSEDVTTTLESLKKLGIKTKKKNKYYEIFGNGIGGYQIKNNTIINAGNSGTLGRLLLGLLVGTEKKIKFIGDKSLARRDFSRVIDPLKKFGAKFNSRNGKLPLTIYGSQNIRSINYTENKGSAQCKSCVMLAALSAPGTTKIKAKKSRDHTELLLKYLKVQIKIKKNKQYDYIQIKGGEKIPPFNYNIPGDISSSAFFIVLTLLTPNSKLKIKNVNVNQSRIGAIKILKMMGAKIKFENKKDYKGEKIADIEVSSSNNLKAINCPTKLNSSAIDEFLIIFLAAAKAKGMSTFKSLSELDKKESPRLKIASNILNKIGIKTQLTKDSIKIYGQPNICLQKDYTIKNFYKDHRVFMMSTIAALTFGGKWKINDPDSVQTSFPSFLKIIKSLGGKFK